MTPQRFSTAVGNRGGIDWDFLQWKSPLLTVDKHSEGQRRQITSIVWLGLMRGPFFEAGHGDWFHLPLTLKLNNYARWDWQPRATLTFYISFSKQLLEPNYRMVLAPQFFHLNQFICFILLNRSCKLWITHVVSGAAGHTSTGWPTSRVAIREWCNCRWWRLTVQLSVPTCCQHPALLVKKSNKERL